jgi:hypothetical protein
VLRREFGTKLHEILLAIKFFQIQWTLLKGFIECNFFIKKYHYFSIMLCVWNFLILCHHHKKNMDTPYIGNFLQHGSAHWAMSFTTTTYKTQNCSQIQEKEARRETHSHIYKPANTYYINTRQGKPPEKYTCRRATHNYYTQIKHKKTFYKH